MFSFAIIIFREILEISLVLGVLLAATKNLSRREKWFWLGILAGIFGSIVVALCAQNISQAMQGMGQELFNAIVLLSAAVLVAWTVVWMKHHAKVLVSELKEVGKSVIEGKKPYYVISLAIALTVLRDGSEIVMLTYGVIASGQTTINIIIGSLLGLSVGIFVGLGIYLGLVKIATHKFFSFTSWMLIFLAAGMVSQAVSFLTAAGILPDSGYYLWDSSRILSQGSWLGQILSTLVGYCERPSVSQMVGYLLTFGVIIFLMKFYERLAIILRQNLGRFIIFLFLVLGLLNPSSVYATKKVYSPLIEKGELEFEARGDYAFDRRDSQDAKQKQKYAVGYGLTEHWATEVYGEIEKEAREEEQDRFKFTSLEWENRFSFFEPGEKWLDFGLYFAYETSFEDHHPDNLEGKILLEKTFTNFTHTANIIFEKAVGGNSRGHETETGFAWSSKYRMNEKFQPGFEWHSEFGELREHLSWDEQTHQVGPVIYGKLGPHVKYDIGYLFGVTDPAPEGILKWIIELEKHF